MNNLQKATSESPEVNMATVIAKVNQRSEHTKSYPFVPKFEAYQRIEPRISLYGFDRGTSVREAITERRQDGCIAAQEKPGCVGCFSLCLTYSTRQLGTPNYLVSATGAQKQNAELTTIMSKGRISNVE